MKYAAPLYDLQLVAGAFRLNLINSVCTQRSSLLDRSGRPHSKLSRVDGRWSRDLYIE